MKTETATIILRSTCVGIAAVALAAAGGTFIAMAIAAVIANRNPSPPGSPEVGWGVVVNLHDYPRLTLGLELAACLVFVIGFTIGWRTFSGAKAQRGPTR